jgi:hypothetical protein
MVKELIVLEKNFTPIMTYCGGMMVFVFIGVLQMTGISETLTDFVCKFAWFGIKGFNFSTLLFIWAFGGLVYLMTLKD